MTTMKKHRAGNLEVFADFFDTKDWCVVVKSPKESVRFIVGEGCESAAVALASVLASMIRESQEGKVT